MPRSINPAPQFLDSSGEPLAYGLMYFFESGTNTPKVTYKDANLTIPNTHPVVLNADGTLPNVIYEGSAKQILTDADLVQRWERDPVGTIDSTFGNQWSNIIIYSLGEVVRGSDGIYYESVGDGNQGNDPVTTSGLWKLLYSIQWSAAISYQVNASVLGSDGILYTSSIPANLGNDPVSSPNEWANPATINWSSLITYGLAANVRGSDGALYESLAGSNLGNDPISDPTKWKVAATMAWQSGVTYADGAQVVGSDGIVYDSLAGSNIGNDPISTPASWVPAATIDYQSTSTYASGANVTENDVMYYSKIGSNLNNLPSTSPTEWGIVAFQWSAAQTYGLDANVIGSDGLFYQSAIGANVGNDPISSPTEWFSVMALVGAVVGTSTSSVLVGTGPKTWTTQTGLAFAAGNNVKIVDNAAPATNFMVGTVTSYTSGTGVIIVEVDSSAGGGTLADWTITVNSVQIDDITPSTSTVYSSSKTESLVKGSMELLSTQVVTVATTYIDFASLVDDALYSSYQFVITGVDTFLEMQLLNDSDVPVTTGYRWSAFSQSYSAGTLASQGNSATASYWETRGAGTYTVTLTEPPSGNAKIAEWRSSNSSTVVGSGSQNTAFTLGGVRFMRLNGVSTIDNSTISMYGILK